MSRYFGPITQNGYVVADVEQAMTHWIERLGVGPFFVLPTLTFGLYRYKGVESFPELKVALAYSGDLQIELIQQINGAHSFYRDFLEEEGPGLQHVAALSMDYDKDTAAHAGRGLKPLTDGVLANGARFTYYETRLHNGCVMEVLDATVPPTLDLFRMIRAASVDWDGNDPIRRLDELAG